MQRLTLPIKTDPLHRARLVALQERFALACNRAAQFAAAHQSYSRVTLHHLSYKALRSEFEDLGSQLISNSIYAVCRAAKQPGAKGQVLKFSSNAPVFFDRHTLSLKEGRLSMLTLEGRMRFEFGVSADLDRMFKSHSIKEVTLERLSNDFVLNFTFKDPIQERGTL